MKKILPLCVIICSFWGCEEVIDLKLDTQEKEMVVDANIDWEKGTTGNTQKIILSYTNDYYTDKEPEKISGATIQVTTDNETFLFVENTQNEYVCDDFNPTLGKTYFLSIDHNGKQYSSQETMLEVPSMSDALISQIENSGFMGDEIMLKIDFYANPNEQNSFLIKMKASRDKREHFFTLNDKYYVSGKFSFFINGIDEKFDQGDTVDITLYRISEEYRLFFEQLSNISLENAAPFVFPARIYGNVINRQNTKENPLGAFRVSQYSKITYTIQ